MNAKRGVDVLVTARLVARRPSNREDASVPGIYRFHVEGSVPSNHLRSAALDLFHASQGVEVLDDFEFSASDLDGAPLPDDGTAKDYQYADDGYLVSVSPLPMPAHGQRKRKPAHSPAPTTDPDFHMG